MSCEVAHSKCVFCMLHTAQSPPPAWENATRVSTLWGQKTTTQRWQNRVASYTYIYTYTYIHLEGCRRYIYIICILLYCYIYSEVIHKSYSCAFLCRQWSISECLEVDTRPEISARHAMDSPGRGSSGLGTVT
jgi:hypothetical protein